MASADILHAAHSDLPWVANDFAVLKAKTGSIVCDTGFGSSALDEANAAFIVRACNAHYQMLEALKETRALVSEAANTGFNCFDGTWAERLYRNNGRLTAAIAAAEAEAGR